MAGLVRLAGPSVWHPPEAASSIDAGESSSGGGGAEGSAQTACRCAQTAVRCGWCGRRGAVAKAHPIHEEAHLALAVGGHPPSACGLIRRRCMDDTCAHRFVPLPRVATVYIRAGRGRAFLCRPLRRKMIATEWHACDICRHDGKRPAAVEYPPGGSRLCDVWVVDTPITHLPHRPKIAEGQMGFVSHPSGPCIGPSSTQYKSYLNRIESRHTAYLKSVQSLHRAYVQPINSLLEVHSQEEHRDIGKCPGTVPFTASPTLYGAFQRPIRENARITQKKEGNKWFTSPCMPGKVGKEGDNMRQEKHGKTGSITHKIDRKLGKKGDKCGANRRNGGRTPHVLENSTPRSGQDFGVLA